MGKERRIILSGISVFSLNECAQPWLFGFSGNTSGKLSNNRLAKVFCIVLLVTLNASALPAKKPERAEQSYAVHGRYPVIVVRILIKLPGYRLNLHCWLAWLA